MQRWFLADNTNLNKRLKPVKNEAEIISEQESVSNEKVYVQKTFTVSIADLEPHEAVFLTGNLPELGEWRPKSMVSLVPQGVNTWAATLDTPAETELQYRYCVAVVSEEPRKVSVRRWESAVKPRSLPAHTLSAEDTFGEYNDVNKVSKGWLTEDTLVQFKFFSKSLRLKTRIGTRALNLKVTPLSLTLSGEGLCAEEGSVSTDTGDAHDVSRMHIEVSTLSADPCLPQPQSQFGTRYRTEDILFVNVRGPDADKLAYLLDVYSPGPNSPEDVPAHVASAYILPDTLTQRSEARMELPLTCHVKQRPIGSVRVEFLIVRPIPEQICDLSVSYSNHWDSNWTGLEVGHRGLGASFKTKEGNAIRENTIASLKHAAASGADLLEFDVQLSRDLVPVIYHDYHVCISMRRKKQVDFTDMLELPVKDLTLEQLHQLKVYHLVEGRTNEPRFFDEDLEEHQPFPTLESVLDVIEPHVGFNVELKWTMERNDGSFELSNPFDMNTYVDKVLEVLLRRAGQRRVVLSGFNPDICTMLCYKQNKYPVMFLTQGQTERYPSYRDERCLSVLAAVRHAVNLQILGVVAHTEDLLRDPSQVKLATDAGLVIFCWGDDNNNTETILKLKDMGLHAVIYDKLDKYTTKQVKESIFLVEARESQRELLREVRSVVETEAPHASSSGSMQPTRSVALAARGAHASASVATVTSQQFDRVHKRTLPGIAHSDKELQHKTSAAFLGEVPPLPDAGSKRMRSRPSADSAQ